MSLPILKLRSAPIRPLHDPCLSVAVSTAAGSPALVACTSHAAYRTATSGSRLTHSRLVNRRRTRLRRWPSLSTTTEWSAEDVAPGRTASDATRASVASSIQLRTLWESILLPAKHDLPECLVRMHQL